LHSEHVISVEEKEAKVYRLIPTKGLLIVISGLSRCVAWLPWIWTGLQCLQVRLHAFFSRRKETLYVSIILWTFKQIFRCVHQSPLSIRTGDPGCIAPGAWHRYVCVVFRAGSPGLHQRYGRAKRWAGSEGFDAALCGRLWFAAHSPGHLELGRN